MLRDNNNNQNPPTFAKDSKQILRFASPYVTARLLNAANWFISMAIIACLGSQAVAAGILIYSSVITVQLMAWAVMYAVAVVVGKAYGAGKLSEIGKIVQSGIALAFCIGLPMSILLMHLDSILLLLHQPAALVALARPYFHIIAFSLIPSLFYVVFYKFAMGIAKPRLVLVTMLFGMPINTLLTYLLVLGKYGFPALGISGAAYANLIMYCGLCLGLLLYFSLRSEFRVFRLWQSLHKFEIKYFKQLFRIGWPIGIEWGSQSLAYTMGTYMMGWLGATALAAHQIATQYVNLIIMIPFSIGSADAVLVAQAVGAKKRKSLSQIGYAGLFLTLIAVLIASIFYWLAPKLLISVYLNLHLAENYSTIALAIILLSLMGFNQITDAIGAVATGALRGLADTRTPMLISVTKSWLIGLPIAYLCAFTFRAGAAGIYYGYISGSIISAIWLLARWRNKSRLKK